MITIPAKFLTLSAQLNAMHLHEGPSRVWLHERSARKLESWLKSLSDDDLSELCSPTSDGKLSQELDIIGPLCHDGWEYSIDRLCGMYLIYLTLRMQLEHLRQPEIPINELPAFPELRHIDNSMLKITPILLLKWPSRWIEQYGARICALALETLMIKGTEFRWTREQLQNNLSFMTYLAWQMVETRAEHGDHEANMIVNAFNRELRSVERYL